MSRPLNLLLLLLLCLPLDAAAGGRGRKLEGVPQTVRRRLPRASQVLVLRKKQADEPSALVTRFSLWQPHSRDTIPENQPEHIEDWTRLSLDNWTGRVIVGGVEALVRGVYTKHEGPNDFDGNDELAEQIQDEAAGFFGVEPWTPDKDLRDDLEDTGDDNPEPSENADGNSTARIELFLSGPSTMLRLAGQRGLEEGTVSHILKPEHTGGIFGKNSFPAKLAQAMRDLPWLDSSTRPFAQDLAVMKVDNNPPNTWPNSMTEPGVASWYLNDNFFAHATVENLLHGPAKVFEWGAELATGEVITFGDFSVEMLSTDDVDQSDADY